MFTDRDGKYQLAALAESRFSIRWLANSCRFMLTEEAHHMFVGETGIPLQMRGGTLLALAPERDAIVLLHGIHSAGPRGNWNDTRGSRASLACGSLRAAGLWAVGLRLTAASSSLIARTRARGRRPPEAVQGLVALRSGPVATLYLVATPIGNLEDVTLRAIRVLGEVELLLAEDTRRTRVLLERHGIEARPRSLHAHNEAARCSEVLRVLGEGGDVALVSDAGTPLVSDPGERLVRAILEAGHAVVSVPGPSAVLAALGVSGLPVLPFAALGFPPRRAAARRAFLEAWGDRPETLVFFESPHRLAATLREAAQVLGDRPACVARELTKVHEEAARGRLSQLAERFAGGARGEVTVVVGGAVSAAPSEEDVDARIRVLVKQGLPAREVAARVAAATGVPRRRAYARALALREDADA